MQWIVLKLNDSVNKSFVFEEKQLDCYSEMAFVVRQKFKNIVLSNSKEKLLRKIQFSRLITAHTPNGI